MSERQQDAQSTAVRLSRSETAEEWEIELAIRAPGGPGVARDQVDAIGADIVAAVEARGLRVEHIRALESEREYLRRTVDPDSELGRMLRAPERMAVAGDRPPGLVSVPYTGDELRALVGDMLAEPGQGVPIPPVRVHLRRSDDGEWQALYVDGRRVAQNHSLAPFQILEALAARGLIAYSSDEVEVDADDPEAHFPDALP